jgi:hypothetical protein
MSNLKKVLSQYYVPETVLGSERIEMDSLQKDLNTLKNQVNLHFWISVIMIAVIFIIGILVLLIYIKKPSHVAAFFSAMGVSVSGLIEYMRRASKEIAQINLVIILSLSLNEANMASVIQTLLKKLN